ncbi:hypothetical protein RCL1_004522 [Eukaryota sp. TZLM3-RCL]
MGRKKIAMTYIRDPKARQITFAKRKNGIFKKAFELATLTGASVALVINNGDKVHTFSSELSLSQYLQQCLTSNNITETKTMNDFSSLLDDNDRHSDDESDDLISPKGYHPQVPINQQVPITTTIQPTHVQLPPPPTFRIPHPPSIPHPASIPQHSPRDGNSPSSVLHRRLMSVPTIEFPPPDQYNPEHFFQNVSPIGLTSPLGISPSAFMHYASGHRTPQSQFIPQIVFQQDEGISPELKRFRME